MYRASFEPCSHAKMLFSSFRRTLESPTVSRAGFLHETFPSLLQTQFQIQETRYTTELVFSDENIHIYFLLSGILKIVHSCGAGSTEYDILTSLARAHGITDC